MCFKKILAIIIFIGAFNTLIGLGLWQLDRLTWKKNIINQLEAVYAVNALDNVYQHADLIIKEGQEIPILYGSVQGRFDYTREILVGPKPYDDRIGYQVITPLTLANNGHILVSRGFISVDQKDQIKNTHKRGSVTVSGLIREPDWTKFTPNNSPENDVWSKLDIEQIADAKGIVNPVPVILYAEKMSSNFPQLTLQQARWMPRNKHHQYALFWFTMAGILCFFFGFLAYKNKSL